MFMDLDIKRLMIVGIRLFSNPTGPPFGGPVKGRNRTCGSPIRPPATLGGCVKRKPKVDASAYSITQLLPACMYKLRAMYVL